MNAWMLAALVGACGLSAGCGQGDDAAAPATKESAATPPSTVLAVAAPKSAAGAAFRFDVTSLEAKPGTIELRFRNDDTVPHNVRIQSGAECCDRATDVGGTKTINGAQSQTARVELNPGRYWFVCSINLHHVGDLGQMKGRLVVG